MPRDAPAGTTLLGQDDLAHFARYGWVRVPGAFAAAEAAAMREVVWEALERTGIRRADPRTWTDEAPAHLQRLKARPEFRAVGSERTTGAVDDVLAPGRWRRPRDWGAFFVTFPSGRPWAVPSGGWHIDAPWTAPLDPPGGLKVHAMFGDVAPRAGGMTILSGSHRLVSRLVEAHPPADGARQAQVRRAVLRSHPYLRDLTGGGDPQARIARFESEEDVLGVPVRVVELTAAAGDVLLIHPLVLHARPVNAGTAPRFLLNKDLTVV